MNCNLWDMLYFIMFSTAQTMVFPEEETGVTLLDL